MLPGLFTTQEEIVKKIRGVASVHNFENAQAISQIFYDVFKIAFYAVKRKEKGLKRQSQHTVTLGRREITKLVQLIDYHYVNDKEFRAEHALTQCFGSQFTEDDALRFFEQYVEGLVEDKLGRSIRIDLEDGIRFMYKNYQTQTHEMKPEYYLPYRGKRLPWIRHTLQNTRNIYAKIDGSELEIMYLCKYKLPNLDEEKAECYWVVIAKKYKKDRVAPFRFKTAFPMFKYNELLRRLERYSPITEFKNLIALDKCDL